MFGKASLRIILRKVSVALKPKYAPLVRLAKAAYQSGYGRRSGATAAFGQKAWSAKSGSPRSAVVVGLNNKAGLKKICCLATADAKPLRRSDGETTRASRTREVD